MQRYEYAFERVKTGVGFWSRIDTHYQHIIDRRARDGWRFVQAYAPSIGIHGLAHSADLIFERPV